MRHENEFPPDPSRQDGSVAWFCVRSQPKHEHIAAEHLKKELGLEVFLPRIRFKRLTRQGPAWFTEALFPSYLFARFDLAARLRRVHHARGVCNVVHFGNRWPTVPDAAIAELRSAIGAEEVHVIAEELEPGTTVQIAGGAFHGLRAVVARAVPGRQRVAVLLEFLGRQTAVEIPRAALVPERAARKAIL
jgi:transcriptional antiterminator RfaH